MQRLYLDYLEDGYWALSESPDFPFPRVEVCRSPLQLYQEHVNEFEIVLSDAARIILDNDLIFLHWSEYYFRCRNYVHPECRL